MTLYVLADKPVVLGAAAAFCAVGALCGALSQQRQPTCRKWLFIAVVTWTVAQWGLLWINAGIGSGGVLGDIVVISIYGTMSFVIHMLGLLAGYWPARGIRHVLCCIVRNHARRQGQP